MAKKRTTDLPEDILPTRAATQVRIVVNGMETLDTVQFTSTVEERKVTSRDNRDLMVRTLLDMKPRRQTD